MGPTQALKMPVRLEFGVLVALLRFLCCIKAELHIVNTPSPITASLGKNVTIPCVLTEDDHPQLDLDLSIVGIRWRKIYSNGSEIDVYKFLSLNHVPIRPESSIDERKLRRGDVSLTLGHVKRSDEGEYTCTVFVTPNKAWAKINVQVVAQPDVALSTTELAVETESERSVICEVSNYYPETVKIRWVKYSKSSGTISSLDKVTYLTVPEENSDESFNVTSLLTVRPSSLMENGDSYSCKVTHVSLSHDKEVSFILTVK
ncbi:natural cytotoxicity triggering receptor 3 ligand 1-like, partial [Mantella aurantiaca]